MCNNSLTTTSTSSVGAGLVDPFSTFHFLRSYNRFVTPREQQLMQCYNLALLKDDAIIPSKPDIFLINNYSTEPPGPEIYGPDSISKSMINFTNKSAVSSHLPSTTSFYLDNNLDHLNDYGKDENSGDQFTFNRRQRGEKRPIPDEQKDDKYFERRKRNNEAAKKSRDARKLREDRIAFRAAILEQENTLLRAQTLALREEISALQRLLNNKDTKCR